MAIIPNVAEYYVLSDGSIISPTGTTKFHAQSNYANLVVLYMQETAAGNATTLINYKPNTRQSYTSHWFFMSPQSDLVHKTVLGEETPRAFKRHINYVPKLVLQNNSQQGTTHKMTITQRYGSKHLGNFSLYSEFPDATALMSTDLDVAYLVNDETSEGTVLHKKGFYQVVESSVEGIYEWERIEDTKGNNVLKSRLTVKQYNMGEVFVQAGFENPSDIPSVDEEIYFMFMSILNDQQLLIQGIGTEIGEHIEDEANPHETTVSKLKDVAIIDLLDGDILRKQAGGGFENVDDLTVLGGEVETEKIKTLAIQNELPNKLDIDGINAEVDIKLRDTTFDLGIDTDAIKQTDFAGFTGVGAKNLDKYIDNVQTQIDDKLSQTELSQNYYNKPETNALLDGKTDNGHTHVEANITDLDKYSQLQVDNLLNGKTDNGHTHVEANITDLDKYSQSQADTKFMGKTDYLDVHDKVLLSKLPDAAKQQTYVKTTFAELPVVGILSGDKGYVTSTGNSYIWDGLAWQILAQADWENVSLEWANITNPPTANEGGTLAGGVVYNKAQADTLLAGKSDTGHTHLEADITNLDKYTQAQANALLDGKSNTGHTHVEDDITDLNKIYTEQNVVVDGEKLSASIDKLDIEVAKKAEVDLWDNITSSARLFGGMITDNNNGTISIASGGGLIKAESAPIQSLPSALNQGQGSKMIYVEWGAVASLALVDNAYNFIYYHGDTGTIQATTDFYTIDFTRDFTLGRGFRTGNSSIVRLCGTNGWNFNRRVQLFGEEVFPIIRAKGLELSIPTNLYVQYNAGILWAELVNRFEIPAFDSAGVTDKFTLWYRDGLGGFNAIIDQTQLNNTQWDDNGTLSALTGSRYGVHWVYADHEGGTHVVLGRGNYTLAQAELTTIPTNIPALIASYGTFIGRVIVQINATEAIGVASPFTTVLTQSQVTNHNDLSGLQGGNVTQRYHLDQQDYDTVVNLIVDGKINDVYMKESYNDAYTGYGTFNTTDPLNPILLELYPPDQWDVGLNQPIAEAVPYEKRANVVYVTKNVTENSLYRYSTTGVQYIKLMPSVIGLGTVEGTAYEGVAGQENRDRIIAIENDYITQAQLDLVTINVINDITDVEIINPTTRQVLAWNATTLKWNNKTLSQNDVGLANVQNYAISSQLEAETGTANDKYMTPLRTAQAIAALASVDEIDGGTF